MQAQDILVMINAAIKSREFRVAAPKAANRMLHNIAFAACREFSEPAEHNGWGPISIYSFGDGSSLTYDGRGYMVHDFCEA